MRLWSLFETVDTAVFSTNGLSVHSCYRWPCGIYMFSPSLYSSVTEQHNTSFLRVTKNTTTRVFQEQTLLCPKHLATSNFHTTIESSRLNVCSSSKTRLKITERDDRRAGN